MKDNLEDIDDNLEAFVDKPRKKNIRTVGMLGTHFEVYLYPLNEAFHKTDILKKQYDDYKCIKKLLNGKNVAVINCMKYCTTADHEI